jgi:hypothetical protein
MSNEWKKGRFQRKKPYFNELERCDKRPTRFCPWKKGRSGEKTKRGQSMRGFITMREQRFFFTALLLKSDFVEASLFVKATISCASISDFKGS